MELQKLTVVFYMSLLSGMVIVAMVLRSKSCLYGDAVILTIGEISFEKCVEECALRSDCTTVSYHRLFHLCELLKDVNGNVLNKQLKKKNCKLLAKSDWKAYKLAKCDCSIGEKCDVTTASCQTLECSKVHLKRGQLEGNMLSIGSRIKYTCNSGYVEEKGEMYSTCETSGQWSYQPHCIRDCSPYPNVSNAQLVSAGDSTVEGTVIHYGCVSGYKSTGSALFFSCNSDGVWFDSNEVRCEKTIGGPCLIDSDCHLTGGKCVWKKCLCGPLYRYKSETQDCSKVCTFVGISFARFEGIKVAGQNDIAQLQPVTTVSECEDLCKYDIGCLSFEIVKGSNLSIRCNRATFSYEMILDGDPERLETSTGALYSKICY